MRVVIDLQAVQGSNKNRGIGRYSLSLVKAMIQANSEYEFIIVLNNIFIDEILAVRSALSGFLPKKNIKIFNSLTQVSYLDKESEWKRKTAQILREEFINSISPDILLIASIFEGLEDDVVCSIDIGNRNYPVAVVLYDLIPHIFPELYLKDPVIKRWYADKYQSLNNADLLLSISEHSRVDAINNLSLDEYQIVNISTDADSHFYPAKNNNENKTLEKYGVSDSYIMYTGGIDGRKNIEGLIEAFANTSESITENYQLVIVCHANENSITRFTTLAEEKGLAKNKLVFTGYVSEDELVELYCRTSLFVFPSIYEGFGLPVLEAMRCGAVVIGSNCSSIPEVIGNPDALFDPHNLSEMSILIEKALTDQTFRESLIEFNLKQKTNFSWEKSAVLAISAMEESVKKFTKNITDISSVSGKKALAFISPIPPQKSGIAHYSALLLPELSKYYDIHIIVEDDLDIKTQYANAIPIKTASWFENNSHSFDRVIYHFGNSPFHKHMPGLLEEIPGVVVLHDFFLSGLIEHNEIYNGQDGIFNDALLSGHGINALCNKLDGNRKENAVWNYPANYNVLSLAVGVITHSEYLINLSREWYAGVNESLWGIVPLVRSSPHDNSKSNARKKLGIPENAFVICSFGFLGSSKLNDRIIDCFEHSLLSQDENCYLYFVGDLNAVSDFAKSIRKKILNSTAGKRIIITGWISNEDYGNYLQSADLAIQLRSQSRGETSAAVLDCLNYGIPTIVNKNGSFAYIPEDQVLAINDNFKDYELVTALELLKNNKVKCQELSDTGKKILADNHSIEKCVSQYVDLIEKFYAPEHAHVQNIARSLPWINIPYKEHEIEELSRATVRNFERPVSKKQLFVDISELFQRDSKTGIQRVVRNILWQWLNSPPSGYNVEPVYATIDVPGYKYARSFAINMLTGIENVMQYDIPLDYRAGDIFIGLDLQSHVVPAQNSYLKMMQSSGVKIDFVVYDLLPILMPDFFINGEHAFNDHSRWMSEIIYSDNLFCISAAVAEEVKTWVKKHNDGHYEVANIDWFHLGADLLTSVSSSGLSEENLLFIENTKNNATFIMVGTIEPRKCHQLVVDAFTILWNKGIQANLVIVGKQGWKVDSLISKITSHSEYGKQLFWISNASDEYLTQLYDVSSCLIAASAGEGFGLPLIEAAQHGVDIIASDISVFKEVAGDNALYFESGSSQSLADSVILWLSLYKEHKQPSSGKMKWLTWSESAASLLSKIIQ